MTLRRCKPSAADGFIFAHKCYFLGTEALCTKIYFWAQKLEVYSSELCTQATYSDALKDSLRARLEFFLFISASEISYNGFNCPGIS